MLFFSSVLLLLSVSSISLIRQQVELLGSSFVNNLRDGVAVSDLPQTFGKRGHAVLSRAVVSPRGVPGAVHPFMKSLLEKPSHLGVLVADISADNRENSVTLTAAISCLDTGNSNATSLQWWVGNGSTFEPLLELKKGINGAEVFERATSTVDTDIVQKCLAKQIDQTSDRFRIVEHIGIHSGQGNIFKSFTPENKPTISIEPTMKMFDRFIKERRENDQVNEVIYDKITKIPITNSNPFSTSVKIITPSDVPNNEQTRKVRVPATLMMALRYTIGVRLQETFVSPGESRTSARLVTLAVLSNGLALIIASWLIFKYVADAEEARLEALMLRGVKAVVEGNSTIKAADVAQRMLVFIEVLAGIILLTPLAQEIVEGTANPTMAVEVTTGVSCYYGSTQSSLSNDKENPVAGAPFILSSWVTIAHLDSGFYLAFFLSLSVVLIVSAWISLYELRRLNCIMPSYKSLSNFSLWKLYGALRLQLYYYTWRPDYDPKDYRLLIEFRDDVIFDDPSRAQVLLLASEDFRSMAREHCSSSSNRRYEINRSRKEEVSRLLEEINGVEPKERKIPFFSIVATVRLTNKVRYEAMMTQSKIHHKKLPRYWYYLFGFGDDEIPAGRTIEYYRTMHQLVPDKYLAIARLGLLEYLPDIKYIEIKSDDQGKGRDFDIIDDCKVLVVESLPLSPGRTNYVSLNDDRPVHVKQLMSGDIQSPMLKDNDPLASSGGLSMEGGQNIVNYGPIQIQLNKDLNL